MDTQTRQTFVRSLLKWYDANRRDLPWRPPAGTGTGERPDPWAVLVSEAMLQQTQVATVIPYFHRFLATFPTPAALAEADEQHVLRLWQGLGYYRRARNLQAAARAIVQRHGGQVPADHAALLALPGVGPYTAGAVASIAFDIPAPIVDGNVARVLSRLCLIETPPEAAGTKRRLWDLAEAVLPAERPGALNSAMMELGATLCTPKNPQCLICPVADVCRAREAGRQTQIPTPKKARATPLHERLVLVLVRGESVLIEQRPSTGRWAGLWQFPTVEALSDVSVEEGKKTLARLLPPSPVGRPARMPAAAWHALPAVRHALTHRRYVFHPFLVRLPEGDDIAEDLAGAMNARAWVALSDLDAYPLSRPQLLIARQAKQATDFATHQA
ncbi:MAG: A/G-specific adenine glycosylase [Phycisphaerae bacterium]